VIRNLLDTAAGVSTEREREREADSEGISSITKTMSP
jgi:hypothetical protein